MYHASELFIIKHVLDIYTQQKTKTMNACEVLPASSQRQQMIVDQKVKTFTELLPYTLAMYDCRQLEDVSSLENVHMVTEILSQFFIRCCLLHLPSLSSLCHMHLVHLNARDNFT